MKVTPVGEVIGQCKKCGIKVKLSKCEVVSTAHVLFELARGNQLKLTLFERELETISKGGLLGAAWKKCYSVCHLLRCVKMTKA